MAVRKLARSWQYDFTLEGHGRQRKAGFKTKAEACEAQKQRREDLISGRKCVLFADAYDMYMTATTMKDRSRDSYEIHWQQIKPVLGHLFIEEVDTPILEVGRSFGRRRRSSQSHHRTSTSRQPGRGDDGGHADNAAQSQTKRGHQPSAGGGIRTRTCHHERF